MAAALLEKAEWKDLQSHYDNEGKLLNLRQLFAEEPNRFNHFRYLL